MKAIFRLYTELRKGLSGILLTPEAAKDTSGKPGFFAL
jgi:hypothetical protein